MELNKVYSNLEQSRYGIIAMLVIIIGCLGGIAVAAGAINNTFALSVVVFPTMATLSLLLAVSPMKYIFWAALATCTIDILLLLFYSL